MAGKDNFVISDESINGLNKAIETGSFAVRATAYFFFFFVIYLITGIALALYIDGQAFKGNPLFFPNGFYFVFLALLVASPFYFIEKRTRAKRKKEGLSIMGDIREELKQKATNEQVAREMKARDNLGVGSKDLNYYYDLLKSGAITQEEYDVKKAEFLK